MLIRVNWSPQSTQVALESVLNLTGVIVRILGNIVYGGLAYFLIKGGRQVDTRLAHIHLCLCTGSKVTWPGDSFESAQVRILLVLVLPLSNSDFSRRALVLPAFKLYRGNTPGL